MTTIRVLPPDVANQIKAGEVVDRPASVLRELLDNAIDAGATRIRIEIEGGGVERVRVSDDGAGMSREDAELSVLRHATSKLRVESDLRALNTFGFRGEALPSIAAVSRFDLTTRPRDTDQGTRVVVEGGQPAVVSPAGCAVGTVVDVKDLFFNVPARRAFLKSQATESARINDVCIRAALAAPKVGITVLREGKLKREWLPDSTFGLRAKEILHRAALNELHVERGDVMVHAWLAGPETSRRGTGSLYVFVNDRPVRDRALHRAVAFAFGSVMPPGQYPLGVVRIIAPKERVDVNVHPQKAEVRFSDGRKTLDAITKGLAAQLGTGAWSGPSSAPPQFDWKARLGHTPPRASAQDDPWGLSSQPDAASPSGLAESMALYPTGSAPAAGSSGQGAAFSNTSAAGDRRQRVLDVIHDRVIVARQGDEIVFFDANALRAEQAERTLREELAAGPIKPRRLLFPTRVQCTEAQAELADSSAADFAQLGVEVARVEPKVVAIESVPEALGDVDPAALFEPIVVALFKRGDAPLSSVSNTLLPKLADLSAGSLDHRVASELLEAHRRSGQPAERMAELKKIDTKALVST